MAAKTYEIVARLAGEAMSGSPAVIIPGLHPDETAAQAEIASIEIRHPGKYAMTAREHAKLTPAQARVFVALADGGHLHTGEYVRGPQYTRLYRSSSPHDHETVKSDLFDQLYRLNLLVRRRSPGGIAHHNYHLSKGAMANYADEARAIAAKAPKA